MFAEPPASFVDGARALLDAGKGMVFLHHALAGWPAWEDWAHVVGGRFHYQPATLDGVDYPDSGYHHDVTHTVEVVDPDHPMAAGLPASFTITDEVYLAPVFEADVEPVLASTHTFSDGNFWSADLAIRGQRYARDGWAHPPGSNLVGWVKHAGRSPVAYIQFGDGADTYADPNYRLVVRNAIDWAASTDAQRWAAERRERTGRWALRRPLAWPSAADDLEAEVARREVVDGVDDVVQVAGVGVGELAGDGSGGVDDDRGGAAVDDRRVEGEALVGVDDVDAGCLESRQRVGHDDVRGGHVDVVLTIDHPRQFDHLAVGGGRGARELAADLGVLHLGAVGRELAEADGVGEVAFDQLDGSLVDRAATDTEVHAARAPGHQRERRSRRR